MLLELAELLLQLACALGQLDDDAAFPDRSDEKARSSAGG